MNDQIPTIVVCLRSGGDYRPQHVTALEAQIEKNSTLPYRFVCYSNIYFVGGRALNSGDKQDQL